MSIEEGRKILENRVLEAVKDFEKQFPELKVSGIDLTMEGFATICGNDCEQRSASAFIIVR